MSHHSVTTDTGSIGGSTTMFGPYTAHPVAALFPLLRDVDDKAYAELVCSIRDVCGLLDPIVLDGDMILDGRNRYLACIDAGVEPRFVQFVDLGIVMPAHEYAYERNYTRRHLTDEQRTVITAAFMRFDDDEVKRKQVEGGKKAGNHRPAKVMTDSSSPKPVPRSKRTTRAKVAEAAGVSEYVAQKAMNLVQHGKPERVQAVIAGKVKLKDAMPKAIVTDAVSTIKPMAARATLGQIPSYGNIPDPRTPRTIARDRSTTKKCEGEHEGARILSMGLREVVDALKAYSVFKDRPEAVANLAARLETLLTAKGLL